jgi:MraZ protein
MRKRKHCDNWRRHIKIENYTVSDARVSRTMLLGRHYLKSSKKNVFIVPRGLLSGQFFLTQGFEKNLLLIRKKDFEPLVNDFGHLAITDPLVRLLSRLMLGNAAEIKIDTTSRLCIPNYLADFAQLDERAVLVGQGKYLEIWSPIFWQEQEKNLLDAAENSSRFHLYNINFA